MNQFDVQVGDIVELRKPHPCGSLTWRVRRIGADIGLVCQGCDRRVMLTRREFNKRTKRIVSRAADAQQSGDAESPEDARDALG